MSTTIGYQPGFIGDGMQVNFPKLRVAQRRDLATNGQIDYPHFSIFLSAARRFPYFTATNIDGHLFRKITRDTIFPGGSDVWTIDDRAKDHQWGKHLYEADKSHFHRGHMTKREDPQWGETDDIAREAAAATFQFTNCVPQLEELNSRDWAKLETFILEKTCVPENLKVTVLTGPVLSSEDPFFVTPIDDGVHVQLPTLFWKVIYYTADGIKLSRAAFLMGQQNLLEERGIAAPGTTPSAARAALHQDIFQDFEDAAVYQVNTRTVKQLTGLTFHPAREPYKDNRALKLIVRSVQIMEATTHRELLNEVEETRTKMEYININL